ncbi:hypothetical protein MKK84_31230 [Methylobacterium sp. E-065]|uniref:hypothetical protein n=1 Tax=Methylobacterium sp. E-065 TaxID=2836583 RepID=UPI001FB8972F|nr:hypothetical protein [Methylobacterium sp. E-065]MCJ2021834.1 hypothetical protein [Methylobacterium sp. E-065]
MAALPVLPLEWVTTATRWVVKTMARSSLEDVPPGQRMYVVSVVGRSMRAQGATLPDGWERALSLLCGWGDPGETAQDTINPGMTAKIETRERDADA